MLGFQFSNRNRSIGFNSNQVFGGALKQSSAIGNGGGSFINKRKRSLDVDMGAAQPRKARKTSFEGFAGAEKTAKKPVPSFLQPLPPFETAAKVTVIKEFKEDIAQRNGHAQPLNLHPTGRKTATDTIHPGKALCKANKQIGSLSKRIRRLEEQSQYWRRKSLTLGNQNSLLQTEVNKLKSTVSSLESERLALQTKLMRAESDSESVVKEIQSLLAQNLDLKSAVNELNEEIAMIGNVDSAVNVTVEMGDVSPEHVGEIEQALADTLADLTDKIDEIADLKKALAVVSREKSELDEVVTRQTLLSEMVTMSDNDDQKDTQGSQELAKIVKLQGAVEKCMFRIALLSEKNEEYKTIIRMARDGNRPPTAPDAPSMLHTLQDDHKVEVLESLCMQRYRRLLRDAAESLVGVDIPSSMDESF